MVTLTQLELFEIQPDPVEMCLKLHKELEATRKKLFAEKQALEERLTALEAVLEVEIYERIIGKQKIAG